MTSDKRLLAELVEQLEFALSRTEALIDYALPELEAYDVFGPDFGQVLRADRKAFRAVLRKATRKIREDSV